MINMIFAHRASYDKNVIDYFNIYYTNGASSRVSVSIDTLTRKQLLFILASEEHGNIRQTCSGILYMHSPIRAQISGRKRAEERLIKERYAKRLRKHGYKTRSYIYCGELVKYYYRTDEDEERRCNNGKARRTVKR